MNLSLVLHNDVDACKVCGKPMNNNTLEDHFECLQDYNRHVDRYN